MSFMVIFASLIGMNKSSGAPVSLTYVEDILSIVMNNAYEADMREALLNDAWFDKFVSNVYAWAVLQNKPLTTEQARITLRIIHKTRKVCVENGWATEDEIEKLIQRPRYRNAPTQSANIPREVRYLGDNLVGFRFKRNDLIMQDLKCMVDSSGEGVAKWDWVARLWVVPVIRTTIHKIMDCIRDHRFGFDDDLADYLAFSTNAEDEASHFVLDPDSGKIIAVVNDNEIVAGWTATALRGQPL